MEQSLKRAEQFIAQFGPGAEVFTWKDAEGGLRVSEVSFVQHKDDGTIAGASFMQSDPDGLAVCAAVERLAIAYHDDEDVELYEGLLQFQITGVR